ncbi:M23 family metallopeptidase [Hufsiella ginkgonis]|uniref:Peptidoglycan DD-metalloendopeptidase family protein n=1 Tax=Hufsiella ginkgonis TaxID=2695274 RepID=A0A7K1XYQ5_9SPHI|nr:M23 family metallopeptidase [Hufsiella ginkgonis]MXV16125.1 peptidoglycan DD-metalloendopeptidase family protein [Hufsiella ginkgonis]
MLVSERPGQSTILIIDLNKPKLTSARVKTKHITRAKYYVTCIVVSVLSMLAATAFLSQRNRENEEKLRQMNVQLSALKAQIPERADTSKLRGYIEHIEKKLSSINKTLLKRGVRGFSKDAAGGGSEVLSSLPLVENYALMDQYVSRVLSGISNVPLGYPGQPSVTSRFGFRNDPYDFSRTEFHPGLDFRGNQGDAVKSTAGGKVVRAGWFSGYGKCVRVKHIAGYETLYGHLSKIVVREGETITAGQLIGKVGSTGRSTGAHLHYEVRLHNKLINPVKFLNLVN